MVTWIPVFSISETSSFSIHSIICPMNGISNLQGLKLEADAIATMVHKVTSRSVTLMISWGLLGCDNSKATLDRIPR